MSRLETVMWAMTWIAKWEPNEVHVGATWQARMTKHFLIDQYYRAHMF